MDAKRALSWSQSSCRKQADLAGCWLIWLDVPIAPQQNGVMIVVSCLWLSEPLGACRPDPESVTERPTATCPVLRLLMLLDQDLKANLDSRVLRKTQVYKLQIYSISRVLENAQVWKRMSSAEAEIIKREWGKAFEIILIRPKFQNRMASCGESMNML